MEMHMEDVAMFMSGMITMCFALAGLFFLRFWRDSRDRLFAFFALAFFLLAANRAALAAVASESDMADSLYLVRLLAFVVILVAIIDKNRARSPA